MAHQKVTVKLIGEDGNAFSIMGRVAKALRRSGQPIPDLYPLSRMDIVMLIDWLMAVYPRLRLVALYGNPDDSVIVH